MIFTTLIFIFIFFPVCFAIYYLLIFMQLKEKVYVFTKKYRVIDLMLIGISCFFYAWAYFGDIFRLLIYILIIYFWGALIQRVYQHDYSVVLIQRKDITNKKYIPLAAFLFVPAVLFCTFILIHFKYMELWGGVRNYFLKDTITRETISAPLGISFISFSAISYLSDIYLGKASAGGLIDCALYLTFFPKVVSGPIVLWRDYNEQIRDRRIRLSLVSDGINRIMIGFAKKLILADTFGSCIASISDSVDTPTVFGVSLLYMLQIYYDFSGYSDISIGLANMLGVSFKENFNFPYLSCSITEFWRRWHISLGTWFREYIYFPLGGSRINQIRTIVNISIVFLFTGVWHGAGWTYMLWGIINGICNIIERLSGENKAYQRLPKFIKWFLTMGITYFCWELFRFNNFTSCKEWFMIMFGLKRFNSIPYSWQFYFDMRMITMMLIGIFGATFWGFPQVQTRYNRFVQTKSGYLCQQVVFIMLFILSIIFMVNSSYSPFIYFQY